MRVLVTGGSGYLGRAIVAALRTRGHEAIVFARRPGPDDGEAIAGDVTDVAALARAARGVDAICHSAALVTIWERDPSRFGAVNVGGLQNAIAAARAAGHDRFVYTSSFLALPPAGRSMPLAGNDYQRTKAEAAAVADAAAREGFPITRLFPGVIFGPATNSSADATADAASGQSGIRESDLVGRLIRDQRTARVPVAVGLDRTWSFSWIADVAAAHVTALERAPGAASFALGGDNLPQRRLFEAVRARTGARMPLDLPPALARLVGHAEVARARLTGRPPLVTPATVAIFEHDWPLDSRPAIDALGYRITPFSSGIDRLLT